MKKIAIGQFGEKLHSRFEKLLCIYIITMDTNFEVYMEIVPIIDRSIINIYNMSINLKYERNKQK